MSTTRAIYKQNGNEYPFKITFNRGKPKPFYFKILDDESPQMQILDGDTKICSFGIGGETIKMCIHHKRPIQYTKKQNHPTIDVSVFKHATENAFNKSLKEYKFWQFIYDSGIISFIPQHIMRLLRNIC